jgi:hypothetical protein
LDELKVVALQDSFALRCGASGEQPFPRKGLIEVFQISNQSPKQTTRMPTALHCSRVCNRKPSKVEKFTLLRGRRRENVLTSYIKLADDTIYEELGEIVSERQNVEISHCALILIQQASENIAIAN